MLLPRKYWGIFEGLRSRRVGIRVGEVEYTGRITVVEGRVYASLPYSAEALREKARYHIIRLVV